MAKKEDDMMMDMPMPENTDAEFEDEFGAEEDDFDMDEDSKDMSMFEDEDLIEELENRGYVVDAGDEEGMEEEGDADLDAELEEMGDDEDLALE